ncbi:MAG: hypothetical protein LBU70_05720 [Chitinispirillales bacterium]|nr:hypothetical protein [Chitinispirillales bacterium]
MQMLHAGVEDEAFYMRGRFGVDFPIIGYDFGDFNGASGNPRNIFFGITAATHINMLPTSSMKFPVDNFYAVLSLYFSGAYGQKISWRLYPVYHVSAHLADGYRGGDILKADVRSVSSEMVRGEAYYKPFGDILELGAGAGWYYHVCAQTDLTYRADVSILVTPNRFLGDIMQPFALIRLENIYQGKNHFGLDASAGVFAMRGGKGLGIGLRYFDRLHSSYYFERYEKGAGAELMFMF